MPWCCLGGLDGAQRRASRDAAAMLPDAREACQPERLVAIAAAMLPSAGEACYRLLLVVCDVPLGMLHAASRAVDPGYSVSTLNEARSRAKEAHVGAVGCAVLRCTVLRSDEHATTRLCR